MLLSLEEYANRIAYIEKSCAYVKKNLKKGNLKYAQTDLNIIVNYINATLDALHYDIAEKGEL